MIENVIGNIIGIDENIVTIKLSIDLHAVKNLIGMHVSFSSENISIIGEIIDLRDGNARVNLLGEIINGKFVFGVINKPAFSSVVKLLNKSEIAKVISVESYNEEKHLYLGYSAVYDGEKVSIPINPLFSNHFAIFGSTGSGKSCSVARIFQNLFQKKISIPYKSSIFIFDAYGEYHNAFKNLSNEHPQINFKSYTTNLNFPDSEILKIPVWLLGVDDLAILLGADKPSQLPIIEKAMKLITVFAREETHVIKHKNDIISRALLDIVASGRPPAQIRDQLISVLTNYHTKELNLESPIYQPGYTRPLKQCLLIDASGKMREIELVTNFFQSFITDNLELNMPDGNFQYSLSDLKSAFDFALISEGVLKSDKIYDESNVLKVRLQSLVAGKYSRFFDVSEFVSREQYIKDLMTAMSGKKAQIINFNINYVDDRFAKSVTKIFSKLLFDYAKEADKRGALPIHIVLEEAHRYVQNDNDINFLGYNIFERITKEGRKYGVLLGLISQRPSELSETTLSQCSNFLIFKMIHPKDVDYIREIVPNITSEIVKRLRILQPGTCIAFGNAFNVPVIIRFEMPNPAPSSDSVDISSIWFVTP